MLGQWTQQDVGFLYDRTAAIIHGGYMYQFGGGAALTANDTGTGLNAVSSSRILPDGTLGPSSIVGTMIGTIAHRNTAYYILNDHVHILGGSTGAGSVPTGIAIYAAKCKLEYGGTMKNLVLTGRLPGAGVSASSVGCYSVPVIGGVGYLCNNLGGIYTAFKATPEGPQNFVEIGIGPTAPTTTSSPGVTISGDNLILVGGSTTGAVSTIWTAKLNGFSMGPWRLVGNLPVALSQVAAIVVDNTLIVAGGINSAVVRVATVYSAKIDSEGNIVSAFTVEQPLPVAVSATCMVASKDFIYVVGGTTTSLARTNVVQIARILHGT